MRGGAIPGTGGLTWNAVNAALVGGHRGLPRRGSLADVLARERDARHHGALPRLNDFTIIKWAISHYERTGKWPTQKSGKVHEVPEESWSAVNTALRIGGRGLPKGRSLPILLDPIRKNAVATTIPPNRKSA